MKATATVAVRVNALPAVLGAKIQRTGQFFAGPSGPTLATRAAVSGDTILVNPGVGSYPYGEAFSKTLTFKSSVSGVLCAPFDGVGVGNRIFNPGVGASLTLEDIDVANNKLLYANGGGMSPDGGPSTYIFRRCRFRELCNGLLIGKLPTSTVLLEDCEFIDCGDYGGQTHNIYIGDVKSFTMRRCKSRMVKKRSDYGADQWRTSWGHLVKSRAAVTVIEDCELIMGAGTEANRCIDVSNGGDVTIRRNRMEYSSSQNFPYGQLIAYGVEALANPLNHPVHRLIIEDNTIINRTPAAGFFLWIEHNEPTEYSVKGNTFSGPNMPNIKDVPAGSAAKWEISRELNTVQ